MYTFISLEKIILFFSKYNIDFTQFSLYEQSILIGLLNILTLLFYIFMFYICYKLIFKILDWFSFR